MSVRVWADFLSEVDKLAKQQETRIREECGLKATVDRYPIIAAAFAAVGESLQGAL